MDEDDQNDTLENEDPNFREDNSEDGGTTTDCSMGNVCLNIWEVVFNLVSIVTYIMDVGSDIALAVKYYMGSHWWWFALTIGFVFLPSIMMTGCNIIWYLDVKRRRNLLERKMDAENKGITWFIRGTSVLFQCGPVLRNVMAGAALVKKWKSKSQLKKKRYGKDVEREEMDSSILRLFECFLEAIPQLCLQLYIISSHSPTDEDQNKDNHPEILANTIVVMQYISMLTSLVSALWALCAYHRKLTRHRTQTTICDTLLLLSWHLLILTSRIIAISISATFFHQWILLLISCHWFLMLLWVFFFNDTTICNSTLKEFFFDLLSSWAYIFYFFNLERGRSPWRHLVYYSIVYIENAAMVIGWYHFTQGMDIWYSPHVLSFVFAGFLLGVVCQAVYFAYFHHYDTVVDVMRENFKRHSPNNNQEDQLEPGEHRLSDHTSRTNKEADLILESTF